MTITLLDRPAPSGELPEFGFNARGDCCWFLFQPPTEAAWVGVFGAGRYGSNAAAVHWASERAFVIARGRGYFVDTQTRELILQTADDRLQDAVFVPARGLFVVADELRLSVFDRDAVLWKTERLSWDGIRRLEARGGIVRGEAWMIGGQSEEESWSPFTVDLDSRHVSGATYYGPDAVDVAPRFR